ncbi:MAG: Peptidoglycan/LPS O-acetylase OafA/YrhL, contains acyltransferase and SGNH-hydrolase domain [Chitinophagaceae bacterium]|nr:Peptidoglycan/LPS O-acetylase OafA/YrhL, contains acyltransferase and SGNH-hydrolase domain [Chitinophagaceae bacterium]
MHGKQTGRLRELDFLRGIAILLVLCNHQYLFQWTRNVGWIGVDLFFVLSGFLVSGLLFKEHQKFGRIDAVRFLIRRGFKIYPMYYLFYLVYLIPIIFNHQLDVLRFLSDMVFLQNYVNGWGYAFAPSWSLAVEEHFYFGLTFLLWYVTNKKKTGLYEEESYDRIGRFERIVFLVMIVCLVCRVVQNIALPNLTSRNFTMTHLRIDSLLAGVLVAYLFYFKRVYLEHKFVSYKTTSLLLAFLLLAFTPFLNENDSFFVKTIGFTFVYISFSIILIHVLLTPAINDQLNTLFGKCVVTFLSKVGVYSYAIYIIHTFVNHVMDQLPLYVIQEYLKIDAKYIVFPLSIALSVFCGKWMTEFVEQFFLGIRDRYYPSRSV